MATTLSTEVLTVTSERRTWRIQIESSVGTVPTLTAHRELVKKVGADVLSKDQNAGVVNRSLAAVYSEEVICNDGTVVTPAHIAEALVQLIESWEIEDVAAIAPAV